MRSTEIPKILHFNEDGREKLLSGVKDISAAVKSTMGPMGRTVMLENANAINGFQVTKDGVSIAKEVVFSDPVKNLAASAMKQASKKTASDAGDGTTGSMVLAEAFVEHGMQTIKDNPSISVTEYLRATGGYVSELVKDIAEMSKKVTKGKYMDIAMVSTNGDVELAKIISDTYREIGKDGVVTAHRSLNGQTYSDNAIGVKINSGFVAEEFRNDEERDVCLMEDAAVLVTDMTINNLPELQDILKSVVGTKKPLLLVADCSEHVKAAFVANKLQNGLNLCIISPPEGHGYRRTEMMQDLAMVIGAKYSNEKTGDDVSMLSGNALGHAKKVVVSRDKTIITRSDNQSEEVAERIKQLEAAYKKETKIGNKEFILQRIGTLKGGIGEIFIGGETEVELKERLDRADDAVRAVRSAIDEGIVVGGGMSLIKLWSKYLDRTPDSVEARLAKDTMEYVSSACFLQILANAERKSFSESEMAKSISNPNYGYNVKDNKWGDMFEMGVIDPAKVIRCSLQNAFSVASTILSTNVVMTLEREK